MRQDVMEQRTAPDIMLDAFADPSSVRDVVKGILHTIFFHRFFPALTPRTREVLDLTLPYVDDVELETMIEQRVTALVRQLESSNDQQSQQQQQQQQAGGGGGASQRHQSTPQAAYRSAGGPGGAGGTIGISTSVGGSNNGGGGRGQVMVQFFEKKRRKAWLMSRGEDEVCWESWTVKVTVAEPRTESERAKVRRAAEQTLLTTVMKIVTHANAHKDHIPPITAQGANPFPYQINVNQQDASAGGWASRLGIY